MRSDLAALANAIQTDKVLLDLIFRDPASEFEKKYCTSDREVGVAVYDKVENCLIFSMNIGSGKFHKVLSAEYCNIIQSALNAVRTSPELQFAFNVLNENARKSFRVTPDDYTDVTCKQLLMNTLKRFPSEATEQHIEKAFQVFVHASNLIMSAPAHLRSQVSSASLFSVNNGSASMVTESRVSTDAAFLRTQESASNLSC